MLGSVQYWDLRATAGLLKSFLRELPASILTRGTSHEVPGCRGCVFFAIFATLLTFFVDFLGPQESIGELSISSHLLISYCQLQSPPSAHCTPRSNCAELVLEQDDDAQRWNRLLPNAWYTPCVFGLMLGIALYRTPPGLPPAYHQNDPHLIQRSREELVGARDKSFNSLSSSLAVGSDYHALYIRSPSSLVTYGQVPICFHLTTHRRPWTRCLFHDLMFLLLSGGFMHRMSLLVVVSTSPSTRSPIGKAGSWGCLCRLSHQQSHRIHQWFPLLPSPQKN